jgi:pSer/pThr/pTyr-binding forkhead associated (FHA) protein
VLKDLKSTNGTFLNDKKITSPSVLKHGDKITVGKTIMQFIVTEKSRGGSYTL